MTGPGSAIDPRPPGTGWLLIRRNRRTGNWPTTAATHPATSPSPPWSGSPDARWTVEEYFQAGKELAALDEHQVRRWTSWHRWTVLAMLAHAFLSVVAATEHARRPARGLIPLTRNEIRRLLTALISQPARAPAPCAGRPGDAATSARPHQPLPATSRPRPVNTARTGCLTRHW